MRVALGSQQEIVFLTFLMEEKVHIVYMPPKFHCELNPIERVVTVEVLHKGVCIVL